MSLLETPTGHLTNLSSIPDNATALTGGQTRHRIPLFPAADDANGRQGFTRVVNQGDAEASIQIEAIDDDGTRQRPGHLDRACRRDHALQLGRSGRGQRRQGPAFGYRKRYGRLAAGAY